MMRSAFTVDVRPGAGARSLLFGIAALLVLTGAFALFRFEAGREVATLRLLLALGLFLVVAPALLVKGLLAGWRALRSGIGRKAALAGLLLNGALLAGEAAVALLAWSTLHSGN